MINEQILSYRRDVSSFCESYFPLESVCQGPGVYLSDSKWILQLPDKDSSVG